MGSTIHRAFNLICASVQYQQGQVITNDPLVQSVFTVGSDFPFVWMYTAGKDVLVNTKTGEMIERVAGQDLITSPIPPGEWRSTAPVDFEVVCFSPFINNDQLPLKDHLSPVVIPARETRLMPHMTQLFLAKGEIQVEGKSITGPKQVLFKSGAKQITAMTTVYGFTVT
jgi:hypothetical protein